MSAAGALALLGVAVAYAQDTPPANAVTLDAIEVIGARRPLSDFPGSAAVIEGIALHEGQRQVNLSEALQRVPGITVLDRQNYAQDLQIQSRGFGARSTFGIRGIKLIVDGVPSSALDGQGQAANFPLGALDRIEVLRGPLALHYGNAAGGAIVGYTELTGHDEQAIDGWIGDDRSHRMSLRSDGVGANGRWRWRLQGSHFVTDGERPHSAAERAQLDGVAEWSPREGERLRLVFNGLTQPDTQDPLGLTRGQWQREPHGTDPVAIAFDARKRIDNHQFGLRWNRGTGAGREIWIGAYEIRREVEQFLALPQIAQLAPSSAGGVIDLGRRSVGFDMGHRWDGERGALAIGIEAGQLDEARRGHENFIGDQLGVRGRLRRDEDNRIRSHEAYVVGDVHLAGHWTLLSALRHTRLRFSSDDHYQAPGNGDDSGRIDYVKTAAALGVARAFDHGEVFASAGRGFETPTVTELAYRPDGVAGFNRDLRPARLVSAEIGARWRFDAADASVTLWRIEGDDEVVPAESRGGRASFANAGRTRREGIEAGFGGVLGERWSYSIAANWMRAQFIEDFAFRVATGGQISVRDVAAGNRIPGIPRADGFAELVWREASGRVSAALEARISDRIATDDRNTDSAPGYARYALRLNWRARETGGWHGFARIDNLFDRDHVGSVIVNEGNGRFFEPGAGRSITLGWGWESR